MASNDVEQKIRATCEALADILVEKNRKYGNSVLEPLRVFSTADPLEQIRVRIDDKLSRLRSGVKDDEDTIRDLAGYLVLYMVAEHPTEQGFADTIHGADPWELPDGLRWEESRREDNSVRWSIADARNGNSLWIDYGGNLRGNLKAHKEALGLSAVLRLRNDPTQAATIAAACGNGKVG